MRFSAALQGRDLLGRLGWFKRLESWHAWQVVLDVLGGFPLTEEGLAVYRQFTGRAVYVPRVFLEALVLCGRGAGKSLVAAVVAVLTATLKDWSKYRNPGELLYIVLVSVDKRGAQRATFNYIRALLEGVPAFRRLIAKVTAEEITLKNGIVIAVYPCSRSRIRGIRMVLFIGDEIAFWSIEGANPAAEVLASIRGCMVGIEEARTLLITSPDREDGVVFETFRNHWGKEDSDVLVWRAPTLVMNPTASRVRIERDLREDPERARAEYEAEFRSGVSPFLPPDLVEAAVRRSPLILPPMVEVRA